MVKTVFSKTGMLSSSLELLGWMCFIIGVHQDPSLLFLKVIFLGVARVLPQSLVLGISLFAPVSHAAFERRTQTLPPWADSCSQAIRNFRCFSS